MSNTRMDSKAGIPDAYLLKSLEFFRNGRPLEACNLITNAVGWTKQQRSTDLEMLTTACHKVLELAARQPHNQIAARLNQAFLASYQGNPLDIDDLAEELDVTCSNNILLEAAEALCARHDALGSAIKLAQHGEALVSSDTRLCRIADYHMKLGQFSQADSLLKQVIHKNINAGGAYQLLANTRKFTAGDRPLTEDLESRLDNQHLDETSRICLHFALGKIYDDLKEYDQAFPHFRTGNDLRNKKARFSSAIWAGRITGIIAHTPSDMSASLLASAEASDHRQAYIIGMLRSGTTFLHQRLAQHPAIIGMGEQEHLNRINTLLEAKLASPYPIYLEELSEQHVRHLRTIYRGLMPSAHGGAHIFLDKNPLNFIYVALAITLFPGSRIIHTVRNPLDTCISIYFQNFAHPQNDYAYDLMNIAHFYNGYRRLMDHWNATLSGIVHEVNYETLVTSTQAALKDIWLYLDTNNAAVRPADSPDIISTASVWQSRQPVYKTSIGRYKPYMQYIQVLIDNIKPEYLANAPL